MIDRTECELRLDAYRAETGRINARGWQEPAARPRRPLRQRAALALVALAGRLAPAVREVRLPDASVPGAGQP